uniref:Uncharacterized protein n=1 Tax=Bactrocera latifrons TaxID=174628 RepID=A0A0K8VVT8_BACLA
MSWKTFNLKRQLSKVNMKIGINVNTEIDSMKNNSVFYTQKESSPIESSGENVSPKDKNIRSESKDNSYDFGREHDSEPRDCEGQQISSFATKGSINANSHSNDDTTDDGDIFDITNEFQTSMKKVEFEKETTEGSQTSRPSDLPLSATSDTNQGDNVCAKTARQNFKEKQRDQRLLSVPNIKYQTRDIRARTNKIDSSPSLSGNVSKKICKYFAT